MISEREIMRYEEYIKTQFKKVLEHMDTDRIYSPSFGFSILR